MLIAFDLDGTVVDSLRDLAASSSELAQEYGGHPLDDATVGRMIGDGAAQLVGRVLVTAGFETPPPGALERYLAIYERRVLDHTHVYPGMIDVLDALAPFNTLALLTNKPAVSAARVVGHLGLDRYFRTRVYGDGPIARKPSPDGLRHLMALARASRDRTLLVGDSGVDLETARAAGVSACLARYGFGFVNLEAGQLRGDEYLIDEPAALPAIVSALEGRARAVQA